jgi:hypothetical protein
MLQFHGQLTVYMRIQFHLDLHAAKSSIVLKGPFFPQVCTKGIESVEQMCDARSYLLKLRTLRSLKGVLLHLIERTSKETNLIYESRRYQEVERDR